MTQSTTFKEHREPLSADDRRTLKTGFILIGVFTIITAGIFTFIFALILDGGNGLDVWPIYIATGFALIFAVVIAVQVFRVVQDLAAGEQAVLIGRVSEKSHYRPDRSRGKRTGSPKYYLHFDDKKIEVKLNHFNKVNVQDQVELRYAPHSKHIFGVENLEDDTRRPEFRVPGRSSGGLEEDKVFELPMTPDDRAALRKSRNRMLLHRIGFMLFSGWFFIGFALQELWGLVLLMSPMVLVFLYQTYKLFKMLSRYRMDTESGYKVGRTISITDKQTLERRGTYYQLYSGDRSLAVDRKLFDAVSIGDRVTEYSTKHSGVRLDVAAGHS